jgi:multidrug transporter EmrE-like cation transporter
MGLRGGAMMFRMFFRPINQVTSSGGTLQIFSLVAGNLLFNILANASFKYSALSPSWRGFFSWQVVGNLAGLITVLTLTWLLRYIPLHVAFPVTTGLAVIGVQIVAARWLFGESISLPQWLGTVLVVFGILLVGGR